MIECEVLAGLKPAAADEVRRVLGRQARPLADDDPTALRFAYAGPLPAAPAWPTTPSTGSCRCCWW